MERCADIVTRQPGWACRGRNAFAERGIFLSCCSSGL
jgi:hypothetical protein